MNKPYQIAAGRSVQRARRWAEEKNPVVQLVLPMIEILTLAKQGAGELIREVGLQLRALRGSLAAKCLGRVNPRRPNCRRKSRQKACAQQEEHRYRHRLGVGDVHLEEQ